LNRLIAIIVASALVLVVSYCALRLLGNVQPASSSLAESKVAHTPVRVSSSGAPTQALPSSSSSAPVDRLRAESVASTTEPGPPFLLDIVIVQGAAATFQTLKVNNGHVVAVSVVSDQAGKLEVHGYRKELEIRPHAKTAMTFTADKTGRFPIDVHGSGGAHIEAAALEVFPQ
jgi:hypothetical protein